MTGNIASSASDNLAIWTTAVELKSGTGRGRGKKLSLYGIGRLRALILDLAVRGKLVEQDAEDETASKLLARIKSEKSRYLSEHRLPKQRQLTGEIEQTPFELPTSWVWTRLNDVAAYIQRGKSPKYADGSGIFVVSQRCVQWTGLNLSVAKEISQASLNGYEPYRFLLPGDLLWNSTGTGTIGRVIALNEVPDGLVCDSHVTLVRCPWISARYLQYWLASDAVYGQIEVLAAGSTNQIEWTAQLARAQAIPLPPLAEQQRIVAKVEELMALCDALEAESAAAIAAHQTLIETLLDILIESTNAADFTANWARLEAHFDTLFTTESSVDALKQTVLELAVRGKLVPQDSEDEPAANLLNRIKSERTRLEASGKAKHGKSLSVPLSWPFAIPGSWVWSQLGHVTNYGQTEKANPGTVPPETWVLELEDVERGTSRLLARVRCSDRPFQSQKNVFKAGDIIYGKLRPYLDKVVIADEQGVCTTEMVPIRGYGDVSSDYIRLFLKTPFFIALATEASHGMNLPRLATEKAREAPFALPPLLEQQRIVSKVEELIALCDALKASLTDVAQTQRYLADAITQRAAV